MGGRRVTWLVLVALISSAAGPARAQSIDRPDDASRAEARKNGYAGVESFQAGDFATARDRLDTAYQLLRVPSLGLWSARALAKLGKLVEADARYFEVSRLPSSVGDEAIQEQARRDARDERAALAPRIPSIVVRVQGAPSGDVTVLIDGVAPAGALAARHQVNPGSHKIEGVRGTTRAEIEVAVREGEQKEAILRFAPRPLESGSAGSTEAAIGAPVGATMPRSYALRTVGWVALGGGASGLVVGAVTALVLRSKKNDLDAIGCDGGSACPPSEAGNVDSYNRLRPVPTISLIAGAALAGVGVYLLTTAPPAAGGLAQAKAPTTGRGRFANVRLAIVPGGTMVSGEF